MSLTLSVQAEDIHLNRLSVMDIQLSPRYGIHTSRWTPFCHPLPSPSYDRWRIRADIVLISSGTGYENDAVVQEKKERKRRTHFRESELETGAPISIQRDSGNTGSSSHSPGPGPVGEVERDKLPLSKTHWPTVCKEERTKCDSSLSLSCSCSTTSSFLL